MANPQSSCKLSIVLVNWNTRDYLLGALQSIYQHPPSFPFEVIVVDNNSPDGSAEAVRQSYPQATLIANQHNAGYADGNNQGIEASTGEFVLLLNPDVVLPEGGLEAAVGALESRTDAAALGVRLVSPDGSTQKSIRGLPNPSSVLCEALGLSRLFPNVKSLSRYRMPWFDYDQPAEVDQPMGTFLLMTRKAIDEIGVLDSRFPIFFNEVDWCYRVRKQGWKILYEPSIHVLHYGGGSTRQVSAKMAWESRNGLLTFYRKHYPSPLFAPVYWVAAIASWIYAWTSSRKRQGQ